MSNSLFLPENMNGFRMHFVGIKGTGMAALVEICAARGAVITGSDVEERFYTDEILERLGIKPLPFSKDNIGGNGSPLPDIVVYSSAYKLDVNPDLIQACEQGVKCVLYTEALGAVSAASYSVGICGVHGKTTVTGMSGTLINSLGLPAQILAGSAVKSFGGSCTLTAGHKYFVAETCEYQRHFMSFHPQKIVLTSVESDHEDYYPTYGDILDAFVDYICLLPEGGTVIYCSDDKGACEAVENARLQRNDIKFIPYGEYAPGDYGIVFGKIDDGKQYFSLNGFDAEFAVRIPGHHEVLDAAAAIALSVELLKTERTSCDGAGTSGESCMSGEGSYGGSGAIPEGVVKVADISKLQTALLSFEGAKRRSEIIGKTGNCIFVDDYGHHPTAVKTTLSGFRSFYRDYVMIVDFMSHTYTRTAALLEDFASAFGDADEVILHKIYPSAREVYSGGVNGKILFARTSAHHNNVKYFEEVMDAESYVKERLSQPLPEGKKGYLFITMGAGDNWKLGKALFDELNVRE